MESRKKLTRITPVFWGVLLFIIAQALTLVLVSRIDPFLIENNIYVPGQPPEAVTVWPGQITLPSGEIVQTPAYSSLGPILLYFLSVAAVLGFALALIPLSALRTVLRFLFALMFSWGTFIMLVFFVPLTVALVGALIVGVVWFLIPCVWFHDAAMILALVGLGAVFGRFITPWTAMILVGALAIYDFLAVHFGFMVWMADKLSQISALPALIIPRRSHEWGSSLKNPGITNVIEAKTAEREYSILGGGDIAFPGLLTASVYFSHGLAPGIIMAAAGVVGLGGAYLIQSIFLKGKAIPALPPITICVLIGLTIIQLT